MKIIEMNNKWSDVYHIQVIYQIFKVEIDLKIIKQKSFLYIFIYTYFIYNNFFIQSIYIL